ncbi:MAG: glutaredoxin 3 [Bdellovibrionota bacterium]
MYTKGYCPFCDRAKDLFKRKGVSYEEISLDDKPDAFTALKMKTGMMTVPQIFIGDQLVGGYQELSALERESKLAAMLK